MWLIVGDGAPVSLGLLSDDAQKTLAPAPATDALFRPGAVLVIWDEPSVGSPTSAPTDAVLALGTLIAL